MFFHTVGDVVIVVGGTAEVGCAEVAGVVAVLEFADVFSSNIAEVDSHAMDAAVAFCVRFISAVVEWTVMEV